MSHKKTLAFLRLLLTVIVFAFAFSGLIVFGNAANDSSIAAKETENVTPPDTETGEDTVTQPTVKRGITEENGKIYFYNEDGTTFKEGYKEVTVDGKIKYYFFQEDGSAFTAGYKPFTKNGKRVYYYFTEDGTAFTDGYLNFEVSGKQYYFFFQEDGSAFTDGYKEIIIDGKTEYFYFLVNGQGFNTGYKTVMIDGKKYYFYFDESGRAVKNELKSIPLGSRTAYMLFNEDGKAFTNGYKEIEKENKTNYYYFLMNGQAFTTGYKIVKINGATEYFFFQDDGTAFTKGFKKVPFGNEVFYYYFQENGRAFKSSWKKHNDKTYYFQDNGRAARKTFLKIDKNLYYFNGASTMKTGGWFRVDKGYYYAEKNGSLVTNKVVEGYKLDSTGKSVTKYRIIQYVKKYTNDSMTNQEKIKALYDWILTNNMTYIRTYEHTKSDWVWKDSWVDDMAKSQMDNNGGNCFRYAAFLGMLIKEATGLPVKVYHGQTVGASTPLTPHGWVTVYQDNVWYVYDVELDKYTNHDSSFCYKVPASKSRLHLQGVGTKLY